MSDDIRQAVLDRAFAELGEHFTGVVIAVVAEVEAADNEQEAAQYYYSGGRLQALGLCHEAIRSISERRGQGEEGGDE
jgi:hypothetical protein